MLNARRTSSKETFKVREDLINAAKAHNKAEFLRILREYPHVNDLDIGEDLYFFGRYKTILGDAAMHLDEECCYALLEKVGSANFINALNTQEMAMIGEGYTSQPLRDICEFQPYSLISYLFNTFHIGIQFPDGRETFTSNINTNKKLSSEEKVRLYALIQQIYDIRNDSQKYAETNPQEFIAFYKKHRPIFPRYALPPQSLEAMIKERQHLFAENPRLLSEIKAEHKKLADNYALYKKIKNDWEDQHSPLFRGINQIAYKKASEFKEQDVSVLQDMVQFFALRGGIENSLDGWGFILRQFWPSHYIQVDPHVIDYLIQAGNSDTKVPNLFSPYLTNAQCELIGMELALRERNPDYLAARGFAVENISPHASDRAEHELKRRINEDVEQELLDAKAKAKIKPDIVLPPPVLKRKQEIPELPKTKETKSDGADSLAPSAIESKEELTSAPHEDLRLANDPIALGVSLVELENRYQGVLNKLILDVGKQIASASSSSSSSPPHATRVKFFDTSMNISGFFNYIQKLVENKSDNYLEKLAEACNEVKSNLRDPNLKGLISHVEYAANQLVEVQHKLAMQKDTNDAKRSGPAFSA